MENLVISAIKLFPRVRMLVIGESTIDIDSVGPCDRIAAEAPVPVVTVKKTRRVAGRACNAAINGARLGSQTSLLSVVGNDKEGSHLRSLLHNQDVITNYIFTESGRQTQTVHRVFAGNQMLVRFDQGTTTGISSETEKYFLERLRELFAYAHAVLISDYGYGIVSDAIINELAVLQTRHPKPLIIDSKYLDRYRQVGATVAKSNYMEALTLLGLTKVEEVKHRIAQLLPYSDKLRAITGADNIVISEDSDGSIVLPSQEDMYHIPGNPVEDAQSIGADDAYSSALTLALSTGASIETAVEIAQAAATVVSRKKGTAVCRYNELLQFFTISSKFTDDYYQLTSAVENLKKQGKRIILTDGCFDILHSDHVAFLQQAKTLGDVLVVALNSDESVGRKGLQRPVNSLPERIEVISGLATVDLITSFDKDSPANLIRIIRPDIYIKAGGLGRNELAETELVEKCGGRVVIVPLIAERSTTNLVNRIQSNSGVNVQLVFE